MSRPFLLPLLSLAAALDAQSWRELLPRPRTGHALAYDIGRGRTVLYGGYDGSSLMSDTWEHDGTRWSRVSTALTPTARSSHALAYDAARSRIVLFGGLDANNV